MHVNDANRLAAVQRLELIDTLPEPEYDELVQIAAAICEVPISLLSFIDDKREWYKANVGMPIPELPIEATFCQYTIAQDNLLLVEDTWLDPLFASHPSVLANPSVRFYAGISIKTPDGLPVGTICVADTVPRQLSSTQSNTLIVLARHANALLELREQRRSLERALAELQVSQAAVEAANVKLLALATTDALTGIANRRAFDERLAAEFAQSRRKARPLSVIMVDIDNFKLLNDRYGHEMGDLYLKQLASLLARTVRESDLVARYGGEEFIILLPDTDEAQSLLLARRLLAAIYIESWHSGSVTVSGGIAEITPDLTQAQQLLAVADSRLYAAKHAGKNRLIASDGRRALFRPNYSIVEG